MSIKKLVKDIFPCAPAIYHEMQKEYRMIYNLLDRPIIILLYHRVAELETDPQMLAVSPENFSKHMRFLKKNYDVLRFEDDWEKVKSPSVVVTFDDGYVDNLINAKPILEQYDVSATIFVATGNIGNNKEFWWDDVERIILLNDHLPDTFTLCWKQKQLVFDFSSEIKKYDSYRKLHVMLKAMQFDERIQVLNILEDNLTPNVEPRTLFRTLNVEELIELDSSKNITIGGHTVTHTQLSIQSTDMQRWEILESKKSLEKILGHKITTFSYPFGGKQDYTMETVENVRKAGYIKAASNYSGQIHAKFKNYHEYPRHLVRNWDIDRFKAEINAFWTN